MYYFVAKSLRCNDGDFIADTFVGFEIEGKFWVVPLDNDLCRFFNCLQEMSILMKMSYDTNSSMRYLCANATHDCDVGFEKC